MFSPWIISLIIFSILFLGAVLIHLIFPIALLIIFFHIIICRLVRPPASQAGSYSVLIDVSYSWVLLIVILFAYPFLRPLFIKLISFILCRGILHFGWISLVVKELCLTEILWFWVYFLIIVFNLPSFLECFLARPFISFPFCYCHFIGLLFSVHLIWFVIFSDNLLSTSSTFCWYHHIYFYTIAPGFLSLSFL